MTMKTKLFRKLGKNMLRREFIVENSAINYEIL